MELILIRHGQSEANAINHLADVMFTGRWECHLTPEGVRQASSLKNSPWLSNAEHFYVSDSVRAQETAACFADPARLTLDSRLQERSLGVFEGRSIADVQSDPAYRRYFSDPAWMDFRHGFGARAPGGENYSDVCARVRGFLKDVKRRRERNIVVVSHLCAIRCMVRELLHSTQEQTLALPVPQCVPLVYRMDDTLQYI